MDADYYAEYARVQDLHWWFRGRREVLAATIARRASPPGGAARILDVGCGPGPNLGMLSRFGTVVGVDADERAVALCEEAGWDVKRVAPGAGLPFGDDTMDLVTLLDVIEHVDDDAALLREAARVLAPGGTMLVTVPAYRWMWGAQDEISHHRRRYTRGTLLAALSAASLRATHVTYFNTILFPPIAAVRLLRRLLPDRGELRSDFEAPGSRRLNGLLARAFALEAHLAPRVRLPFGVSLLATAVAD